jgi:hypothetical protein
MPPMPAGMAWFARMFAVSILLRNAGRKYVLNMNNCPIARLKVSFATAVPRSQVLSNSGRTMGTEKA